MLAPLHKAAKKPFVMTDEMKKAFDIVKNWLQEAILLAFPDFKLPFTLSTDTSYADVAGILFQCHPDGHEDII